ADRAEFDFDALGGAETPWRGTGRFRPFPLVACLMQHAPRLGSNGKECVVFRRWQARPAWPGRLRDRPPGSDDCKEEGHPRKRGWPSSCPAAVRQSGWAAVIAKNAQAD